jgi:hypothetical protein
MWGSAGHSLVRRAAHRHVPLVPARDERAHLCSRRFTSTPGSPCEHSEHPAEKREYCAGTGLAPPTSAPGLGPPAHICAGTGLTPTTSAPGLGSPANIRTGSRLTPPTSAPGRDAPSCRTRRWRGRECLGRAPPASQSSQSPAPMVWAQSRADLGGVSPVRRRCGRGEPGPGADVDGVSPVPAQTRSG